MEIVAMDMKLRGSYIARQLSFHGVTFRIDEVMLDEDFRRMYDESVKLVSGLLRKLGLLQMVTLNKLDSLWHEKFSNSISYPLGS